MALGRILVGVACSSVLSCGLALAQVAAPTGQTGGLFGRVAPFDTSGTSAHRLTLQISGSTGRDENTDDNGNPLPSTSFGALQSGRFSSADAAATYSLVKGETNITATARTYVNFANEGVGRIYGSSGSLSGSIALSPRSGLVVNSSVSYDPTVVFDAFGPVAGQVGPGGVPGASPTQGVTQGQFVSVTGSGGVYRGWSPRQRTTLTGTAARREASRGTDALNTWYGGAIRHNWAVRQRMSFDMGYRIDSQDLVTAFRSDTVYTQGADAVLSFVRPLSPTRSLAVAVGAGASWLRSPSEFTRTNVTVILPTYSLSTRITTIRNWELGADVRRDVTILRGLAPEPFRADAASVRLGGTPFSRLQFQAAFGASRGISEAGSTGSYKMVTAEAQVQFALSRHIGVSSSVMRYIHSLEEVATVDPAVPASFRRTSFRVGVTVWLPVFGRF